MTTVDEVGLQCRVTGSIAEVDPAEWDSILDADDLQATHRFLRTCQDSVVEDAEYRFITVHEAGRLVGTATLSRMHVRLDLLAPRPARAVARAIRRLWPSFLRVPVLFCGLPVSFGSSCLRFAAGADRRRVVGVVARRMEEAAADLGAPICCFKEMRDEELPALDGLRGLGYFRAPSLPSCRLPIRWPTEEAWRADLRSGYRRQVRMDERAAERAGLRVRPVRDFGPDVGTLFRLYEDVWDRAENKLERLNPAFLRLLPSRMPDETRALYVEADGRIVAWAVLLASPAVDTFLLAGVDSSVGHAAHVYPTLVRRVVESAIERGATLLEMGQTSYAMKGRVGAAFTPRYLFLRHRAAWMHRLFAAAAPTLFPAVAPPTRRVFRSACGLGGPTSSPRASRR